MPLLGALSLLNSFTEPLPPDPEEANYQDAVMVFVQSSSPVGWTKITDMDDYTLRVVTGNISTGGSLDFSSVFNSYNTSSTLNSPSPLATSGSTTLSANQIPSHAHNYFSMSDQRYYRLGTGSRVKDKTTRTTSPAGLDQAHNHGANNITFSRSVFTDTIDFSVKYVDVILASRNQ